MTIGYVLWQFPVLTETFISRELLGLTQQGVAVRLYIVCSSAPDAFATPEAETLSLPTVRFNWRSGLCAHYGWLRCAPRSYLRSWRTMLALHAGSARSLRQGWAMWLRAVALSWQARQQQITHVHAHFGSLPASVALAMAQLLGVSFSFSVHGRDVHVHDATLAAKAARARFVLACSRHIRDQLVRRAPSLAARIILHYHGLPIDQDLVEPPKLSQPPLILAVGRLVAKKGFTHLIDACALLKARGISFQAQIIGDGPQRGLLAARIAEYGLSDQIALSGACPTGEVWSRLAESRMLVVPSCVAADGDQDGIPNVILEALACGRPVVASAVGGIPEVIRDRSTGVLVPPASPNALADAIASLLDDDTLVLRLRRHGRALVEQEFSLAASSRRLAEIFRTSQQPLDEAPRPAMLLQAHR